MAEIGIGVLVKVIEKPIDLLWDLISKPVITVYRCNKNVEIFKNKADELKCKLKTVEDYEKYVDRRGEVIGNDLQTWLTNTNDLVKEAEQVFAVDEVNAKSKCFFGMCLNPVSRYKLSKKTNEISNSIAQQLSKTSGFRIPDAYAPVRVVEVALEVKGFEEFSSRTGVFEQIMEELRITRASRIGIYGMAGAGKSMMVREVKRKAEEEKLFDKVVLVDVRNNTEFKRVQKEIARGLGMDQLPEGLDVRDIADRIQVKLKKVMEKGRVLLILDDVWTKLEVEEIGIPEEKCDSSKEEVMRLKILLCSRDCNVLKDEMSTQKEFSIGKLEDDEALSLFKKIVGEKAESRELRSIALEIIEECGGLPLAIVTLANALKNKSSHEWRSALTKLKTPSPSNFTGIHKSVYAAIEVSYSHLETAELKQTLLLSSMFPKNALIQDLLKYGVGLGMFPQANTIENARDELLTLISNLRAASLLIDGSDDGRFDMHDLIRDVALSISHRDRHGLLLRKEWTDADAEAIQEFKWISLREANINRLSEVLESSKLHLFRLTSENDTCSEIPDNFFKGVQKLKVLDLTCVNMSSSSVADLKSLHTLCLDQSMLRDMSFIGEVDSLAVLSLSNSDIEELPEEIRGLNCLQLLDLSGCQKLQVIPPRLLGSLSRLEELYMANNFDRWELEEHCDQRNASLVELNQLKRLTTLEVRISDIEMTPRDFNFNNLIRYKILIGDVEEANRKSSFHCSRILRLKLLQPNKALNTAVKSLPFMNTEELHLEGLNGVKNLVDELDVDGFQDLKYLQVRNCPDVERIISSSARDSFPSLEVLFLDQLIKLEKIFQGCFRETTFLKLREIDVSCCDQLENLFTSDITMQLQGLQEIRVTGCRNLEGIVDDTEQGTRTDIVDTTDEAVNTEFGKQLRVLIFKDLPKLSSFKSSRRITPFFTDQDVFPNLTELQLSRIDVRVIWHTNLISSTCVGNLTNLTIEGCHNLTYLFTSSMARGLSKLAFLQIRECKKMGVIVLRDNIEDEEKLIFPKLSILVIQELQSLDGFFFGNFSVEFPLLNGLAIWDCPQLKGFDVEADHILFNERVAFPKLETLAIQAMGSLNKIWDDQLEAHSFLELNQLFVYNSKKLLNVFPSSMAERLTKLSKFEVSGCDLLKGLFDEIVTQSTSAEASVKIAFPSLVYLNLYMLPELVWVAPQDYTIEFPMLRVLEMSRCHQVQCFASEYSIFERAYENYNHSWPLFLVSKDTFSTLEKLVLKDNIPMNEIWHGKDEGETVFTKLKHLQLDNLYRLESFCSSNCDFGFPSLEDMIVTGCPRLYSFSVGGSQTPKLQKVKVTTDDDNQGLWTGDLDTTISEMFTQKVGYSELKELKIAAFPELISIWNEEVPEIISWGKLTHLEVCDINSLRYILTPSMARDLVQLESLKVIRCDTIEQVISDEEGSQEQLFPKMEDLVLENLPMFKRFCYENSLEFSSLRQMWIRKCPLLRTFITSPSTSGKEEEVYTTPLFDSKVSFPKLERLILESIGSLNMIWDAQLDEDSFCHLHYLAVSSCHEIRHIFPSSMMERLERLDRLEIWNCRSLEKVFEFEGQDATSQSLFVFPDLIILDLDSLPKMKYFSPQELAIEFPSLKRLEVNKCDQVQIFASFQTVNGDKQREVPTACHLFSLTKDSFSSLEALKIARNGRMEKVWSGMNPNDEVKEKIVFSKLEKLCLLDMPRLDCFGSSNYDFEFPSLDDVVVRGCQGMQIFDGGNVLAPKWQSARIPDIEALNQIRPKDMLELTFDYSTSSDIRIDISDLNGVLLVSG